MASGDLLSENYRPIIRGFFLLAAAYYAVMIVAHWLTREGDVRTSLICVSLAASCSALLGWRMLRHPIPKLKLELTTLAVDLMVLCNVIVALRLDFHQSKLTYFLVMVMIFAFASASTRQALLSIAITLAALFHAVFANLRAEAAVYGFVGFSTAVCAVAIARYIRRTIAINLAAQHEAEQRREEAERLGAISKRQSRTDSLTGLPNRRAFFEQLEATRSSGTVNSTSQFWLIMLDLDSFKPVNDHHGHRCGDQLLKQVALRLSEYCAGKAFVSRVGGDEFNIILGCEEHGRNVQVWCDALLQYLRRPYQIGERVIQIGGSIGCKLAVEGESDETLIEHADYALMEAKRAQKGRAVLYQQRHAEVAARRFRIDQAIRSADLESEFSLCFQPQVELATMQVVRFESLLRWRSPRLGDVSPGEFIAAAEEAGLISPITMAVVDKAISFIRAAPQPIAISINLSAYDLTSPHVVPEIIARVRQSRIAPSQLEFEVTETAAMADLGLAQASLARLAQAGHPIALDDFGTGYSNFSYLRSLPITKVKVDRSFLADPNDPMTEKVLRSLVFMAQTLEVACLVEGIETEAQLDLVKRVGASHAQGYLLGRPGPQPALIRQLREHGAHLAQHNLMQV